MTRPSAFATPEQLVEYLQLGPGGLKKLQRMRKAGTGPAFMPVGRSVRYAWIDVHAWCRENGAGRG